MRITKQSIRKMIKEERTKLLSESVADMAVAEEMISSAAENIAGMISEELAGLPDEDPGAFGSPEQAASWPQQVDAFQIELASVLVDRINTAIEETEMSLHDGQFLR